MTQTFQQLLSALTALVMALSAQVGNFTNSVPPSTQLAQVFSPGVQFSINNVGLGSLTYNGQSYLAYPQSLANNIFGNAVFRAPDGTEKCYGWCTNTLDNVTFTLRNAATVISTSTTGYAHTYRKNLPDSLTVRVNFTVSDSRTLKVDSYITNNDPTDTLAHISYGVFEPFQVPGPINSYNVHDVVMAGAYNMNDRPTMFFRGDWGSAVIWPGDYTSHSSISTNYGTSTQVAFPINISNTEQHNRTGGVVEEPILPGQTYHHSFYIRFGGSSSDTASTLAPETFALFRQAFPYLVNWSDRRPVARLFIAEGTKTTVTNPRGYFYNTVTDISDPINFRAKALAFADNALRTMNAMDPKPQGIMLWDLEGNEFYHFFTYVGYPNRLPDIAPEMNAVADEFFAKFKNAGYKIGMTLRPMEFSAGPTLPATCNYNADVQFTDVFIKTDAQYPNRGYFCSAPNTWTQPGAKLPYYQTVLNDDELIFNNLKAKVTYAKNRWGATIFYVDSTVYRKGEPIAFTIFRRLQQEFPDVVFFPENVKAYFWGASSPYGQANMGAWGTPASIKEIYPQAFSMIQPFDGPNYTDPATYSKLVQSVRDGNILFVNGWFGDTNNNYILQAYRDAGITNANNPPPSPTPTPTTPPVIPPVTPPVSPPTPISADLNHDGVVNSLDYSLLNRKWNLTIGISLLDINQDGKIDISDLIILKNRWLKSGD